MWVLRDANTSAAVAWTSVTNRVYALERATNLAVLPSFTILRGNIPGSNAITSLGITNAADVSNSFYRVRVEQ